MYANHPVWLWGWQLYGCTRLNTFNWKHVKTEPEWWEVCKCWCLFVLNEDPAETETVTVQSQVAVIVCSSWRYDRDIIWKYNSKGLGYEKALGPHPRPLAVNCECCYLIGATAVFMFLFCYTNLSLVSMSQDDVMSMLVIPLIYLCHTH